VNSSLKAARLAASWTRKEDRVWSLASRANSLPGLSCGWHSPVTFLPRDSVTFLSTNERTRRSNLSSAFSETPRHVARLDHFCHYWRRHLSSAESCCCCTRCCPATQPLPYIGHEIGCWHGPIVNYYFCWGYERCFVNSVFVFLLCPFICDVFSFSDVHAWYIFLLVFYRCKIK